MITTEDIMELITHGAAVKQALVGSSDPYTVLVPRVPTARWHAREGDILAGMLAIDPDIPSDIYDRVVQDLTSASSYFYRAESLIGMEQLGTAYFYAEAAKAYATRVHEMLRFNEDGSLRAEAA